MDHKIVNTEVPGIPALLGSEANLMAVLVQDGDDRYRAYLGIVPRLKSHAKRNESKEAAMVAAMGMKLTWKKAVAYFPMLPEDKYNA